MKITFQCLIYHFLTYYYLKYLALKTGQLKQAHWPGGNLTHAVKQPFGACYLSGHVFKGVQWARCDQHKYVKKHH